MTCSQLWPAGPEPLGLFAEQLNEVQLLRGHKSRAIVIPKKLHTLGVAELSDGTPTKLLDSSCVS